MPGRAALVGIPLLIFATAIATGCADTAPDGAGSPAASADPQTAFEVRAQRLAQVWRDAVGTDAWRRGFTPLQELTVPPAEGGFTDATKHALWSGWFRLDVGMPREAGGREGAIRYPDGTTATVPLVTLAEAYAELDQGDPPPCPGPTVPPAADAPPPDGGSPDSAVSDEPLKSCTALTVTSVTLGTVPLLTSRGEATVPAWLFTVRELKGPVARVAVAAKAITAVPEIAAGELPPVTGLVGVQDLTAIEGTRLAYRLGVGACDEKIAPVWFEAEDVVVVAGTASRRDGACTDQLLLHPVRAALGSAVGQRPVLDGQTGRILTLRPE
jgi:hypothetical protein